MGERNLHEFGLFHPNWSFAVDLWNLHLGRGGKVQGTQGGNSVEETKHLVLRIKCRNDGELVKEDQIATAYFELELLLKFSR